VLKTQKHSPLTKVSIYAAAAVFSFSLLIAAGHLKLILTAFAYFVSLVFLLWGLYHLPILAAGLTRMDTAKPADPLSLPTVSILIPAKHEPWVIGRAVNIAANHLDYPEGKKEVVVVTEDEETAMAAMPLAAANPESVKIFFRSAPSRIQTKPAALDDVVHFTNGEIIAIFDAEDVPDRDVLMKVMPFFDDPKVGAVQGILRMGNREDAWLARMMDLEYASWFRIHLWGRRKLGFFIPLGGTCCFLRREFLRGVGWWDSKNLTEDLEVAVRLTFSGYDIKMVEVRSWGEAPIRVGEWMRQRGRWMRGYLQTFLTYWLPALRNMRRLGFLKTLSMILVLGAPFVMILVPIGYALTFLWAVTEVFKLWAPGLMALTFPRWAVIPLLFNFVFYGAVLAGIVLENKNRRNLLWLPTYFLYMFLHIAGLIYAFWLHWTRPLYWAKTEHYGLGWKEHLSLAPRS
jgi:cellulose synthase/poly-beta-1,6-N-acetylglucosamine synthase-like glycosyltransferase